MITDIHIPWLEFNIDMNTVHAWMQANAGPNYGGAASDYDITLRFTSEPGDQIRASIASYFASLTPSSPEATNYMSRADRLAAAQAAKATALASATSKLEALGLTADEIKAILGQ